MVFIGIIFTFNKRTGIPITGHEGLRGMWMLGSTYIQPVGWLVLRSAVCTPEESHRYSFFRRLSGPKDQSRHEGVKKNLHPLRHPGSNPDRPAHSQAPCRLSYLSHISFLYVIKMFCMKLIYCFELVFQIT